MAGIFLNFLTLRDILMIVIVSGGLFFKLSWHFPRMKILIFSLNENPDIFLEWKAPPARHWEWDAEWQVESTCDKLWNRVGQTKVLRLRQICFISSFSTSHFSAQLATVKPGGRSCATARPPVSASAGAPALAGSPSIRAFVAKSVLSQFTRFWVYQC